MACSYTVALPAARFACLAPATSSGRNAGAVRSISTGMIQPRTVRLLGRGKSTLVRAEDETKKTVDALDSLLAGEEEKKPKQEAFYVDEKEGDGDLDGAFIYRKEMSMDQKKKLRDEYVSLGGGANTKMGANWFVWISAIISLLAVLTWLQGGL